MWNCRFSGLFIGTCSTVPYAALRRVAQRVRPVRCAFAVESSVEIAVHRAGQGMPYAVALLSPGGPLRELLEVLDPEGVATRLAGVATPWEAETVLRGMRQKAKNDEAKRVLGGLVAAMGYRLIRASAGDGRNRLGPWVPMVEYADGTQVNRYVCCSPARPLPARLRPIL